MPERLSATETAARLGVKPETLYAYVSRGLLDRERGPSGSTFDPLEVEAFAASRRRGSTRTPVLIKDGRPSGGPLMTIETDVALIEDDELYYRGRGARLLAREADFEDVCQGLWSGSEVVPTGTRFRSLPGADDAVHATLATLPSTALLTDRIRVAVPVIEAVDPLRDDLESESVIRRSGSMIATLASTVGAGDRAEDSDHRRIAARWAAGSAVDPDGQLERCINAALVLLVDHDLAASTLAARVAASARANPYAVVSSGLGALDSALHGNVSRSAHHMLAAVAAGEPARDVVSRTIAAGRVGVPGFGHRIYRTRDPRAEMIFELLEPMTAAEPVLAAADEVTAIVSDHGGSFANVDLALAALTLTAGMAAEAGETIFAVARIGGWIAHALDEYSQPPLRLRPVGRYIGP